MLPKISIITPSLNQSLFLEKTICSVLNQKYQNLEYILIDGGSQDGSVEIIKRYADKLSYWESQPDNGHAHALNKGFSKTSGEILAWLNSDDMYMPWTLKVVAKIFTTFPDIDWLVGCNSWWDSDDRHVDVQFIHKNIYDFLIGDYGWIQQESVFFRRSLWDASGGFINENYKFMVDGELWCRFFQRSQLWHLNSILGGYRIHQTNRARHSYNDCIQEMDQAIKTMKKKLPLDILATAQKLKKIKLCDDFLQKYGIPLSNKLFMNVFFKNTVRKAKYNVILYDHTTRDWQKTSRNWLSQK